MEGCCRGRAVDEGGKAREKPLCSHMLYCMSVPATGLLLVPQQAKSEEGYCVVSLPAAEGGVPAIAFLPTSDYNLSRAPPPQHQLAAGESTLPPSPPSPPPLLLLRDSWF